MTRDMSFSGTRSHAGWRRLLREFRRGRVIRFSGVIVRDAHAPDRVSGVLMLVPLEGGNSHIGGVSVQWYELREFATPQSLDEVAAWLLASTEHSQHGYLGDLGISRSRSRRVFAGLSIAIDDVGSDGSLYVSGCAADSTSQVFANRFSTLLDDLNIRPTDAAFDRTFLAAIVETIGARAAWLTRFGEAPQWSDGRADSATLVVRSGRPAEYLDVSPTAHLLPFAGYTDGLVEHCGLAAIAHVVGASTNNTLICSVDVAPAGGTVSLAVLLKGRCLSLALLQHSLAACLVRMNRRQSIRRLSDIFSSVADAVSEGVCVLDAEGHIVFANRRAIGLLGPSRSEGWSAAGTRFVDYLKSAGANQLSRWLRRPDRKSTKFGRLPLVRADASSGPLSEIDARAIGHIYSVLTLYDLTEQIIVQEREVQARSMAMLGAVAAGMAHDFNNILGIIQSNIEVALDSLSSMPAYGEVREDLSYALAAVDRGGGIAGRFMKLSLPAGGRASVVNAGDVVEELMGALRHSLGARIRVRCTIMQDVYVRVVPAELQSALLNIVTNARDSMNGAGLISVVVSIRERNRTEVRARLGWAVISVEDCGAGFTKQALNLATEYDFTTKGSSDGHGFGHYSVDQFVASSKGTLHLRNVEGGGACVEMYLPLCRPKHVGRLRAVNSRPIPEPCSILIVEDEASLRSPLRSMLQRRGHSVSGASSAEMAMQLIRTGRAPDVLVSDVALAGMDGLSLAAWVRDHFPSVKVMLISGFLKIDCEWPLLRKPFSAHELERAIGRL